MRTLHRWRSAARLRTPFRFLCAGLLAGASAAAFAAPAGELHYPDLRNIIPTDRMSIVQTPTGREFRYTHDIFNAGPGPLEIQPAYNQSSGNYQGTQRIYTHNTAGNWSIAKTLRVAGAFQFHADHGHFHFPLAAFGLYAVAPDGGFGAPVAPSPKNGFCIGDSFMYDTSVPHAGTFGYSGGTCGDPNALRGLSVGAVDDYDYRDPGQSIPIDGLPDGTYWFRAIVDPYNYMAEANKSNNETAVKVVISNNTVQALQTVFPDSTPPTVSLTSPLECSSALGTIPLTALPGGGGASVQFLVDGQPLGGPVGPPFTSLWDTTTVPNGPHWLAAQTTNAAGRIATSDVVAVTVANGGAAGGTGCSGSADGRGVVSVTLPSVAAGQLLVAFVSSDGPGGGARQTATVSGGSLSWSLVARSNAQPGTSEIWSARASGTIVNPAISSALASANYDQSLTVIAFNGSAIGASAVRSAATGAPQVQLTTTRAGSSTFAVGNDWDGAVARTLAAGQTMQHQWVDTGVGDTFWVQSQSTPAAAAGLTITIADTAPTNHRWNLAAAEIAPSAPPPPDTTPPSVGISEPAALSTVSGIVQVFATAADDTGVKSVQFYLDGAPLGQAATAPPFVVSWDTRTASAGNHSLSATASDFAGNVGTAPAITLVVDNSAPPPNLITKDVTAFRDGTGPMTTPTFSTTVPGDLLVAFVAYDGPATSQQTATVTGAGLTWSLVARSNVQHGTSEIWSARATGILSAVTVTARPGSGSYHGSLTVIAFANAAGTGVAGIASAPTGAPDVYLPGVAASSWVFAVGNDWDGAVARTPVSGQVIVRQRVDTAVGDTFWVQSTAAPSVASGVVVIHDNAPTNHQWNYAGVEIVATRR